MTAWEKGKRKTEGNCAAEYSQDTVLFQRSVFQKQDPSRTFPPRRADLLCRRSSSSSRQRGGIELWELEWESVPPAENKRQRFPL